MKTLKKFIMSLCAIIALSSCVLSAETITLKNGTVYKGEVIRHTDRSITFRAGSSVFQFPASNIASVTTESTITLKNGTVYKGEVIRHTDRSITFRAGASVFQFPASNIASVTTEPSTPVSVGSMSAAKVPVEAVVTKDFQFSDKDVVSSETESWWARNSEEIVAAGAIAIGIAIILFRYQSSQNNSPYSSLKDPSSAAPGKPFTQAQKKTILQMNMDKNGGKLISDLSGQILSAPVQHTRGYKPPLNEAHVDHINPKSKGGPNSFGNAQILSREENLIKSNN